MIATGTLSELIQKYLGFSPYAQSNILLSLITIIILWFSQRLVIRLIISRIEDPPVKYQWQKIIKYIAVLLGIIFIVRIWFGAFSSLGTYLGLVSAGLAIAFKDLLINMVGWSFILTRQPFKLGDRIQINDIIGDVIDIRLFQFSVIEIGNWVDADQSTGRIIHIPNGIVFNTPQANYTAGFEYIWHEIPVQITFESDWKKAKEILTVIIEKYAQEFTGKADKEVKKAAKKYFIYYKNLTPIVYTTVKDSGIMLTLRFICHARKRRSVEQIVWEDILTRFAEFDNIDLAYPTQRFYNNLTEGKAGTKPAST
ncbi:small-conductance mechanosensitive channel [bacterium BMS3Abin04]|nr:small-conductance mechanosensitive channel [bacterium BMS3Abin04]